VYGDTYRKKVKHADAGVDASRFAVKVFSVDRMRNLHIRKEDVRREASTLDMLRHKNVIRYFGLVETDDEMALVMELASGGSIANFIAKRANGRGAETDELFKNMLFEMLVQIADALDYMHSQGIVHRDIKPDNILFAHAEGTGPLCIKLADFGVAAVLNTVAGSALMSKVGTPAYFSPERGNDKAYGAMADMWALGIVLIELVTLSRLTRGLWNQDPEVSERRANSLQQVARKDELLGKLATGLLHVDKNGRLSACALKTTLRSALRPRARPAAAEAHGVFDLAALAVKLASPQGVHDVLAEVHALCVAQQPGAAVAALEQLRQLHHCLGRHLPVLKRPPMDMHRTLVQLASQEPAGSRLLREAEAALQNLHLEIIEWVNKPVAPLPCVMEIREHSQDVNAVAISPDGKWIASGSDDRTIKIVEMATGRVKCTLTEHRYVPSL
jgi:tRNA A-37 threonylcarbamoyl transferase component Bud32